MRKLIIEQDASAKSLLPAFSASSAFKVADAVGEFPACWCCRVESDSAQKYAIYLGSTKNEALSYLAWRITDVLGICYREAFIRFTEPGLRGKGFARHVLRQAILLDLPLIGDAKGIVPAAFSLWKSLASKCGAVLDIETGAKYAVRDFTDNELWHEDVGCDKYQFVFEAGCVEWRSRVVDCGSSS